MTPTILLATSLSDPSAYVEAVEAAGGIPVAAYCPQYHSRYDALLLCGGCDVQPHLYSEAVDGAVDMDADRDDAEIALIKAFLEAGKPILGICRGCQLLNVYFGGTLHQHLDTAATHAPQVVGNYLAHGATATEGSRLYSLYGHSFSINSHHHQAIKALAPDLTVTMRAEDGVIEAVSHRSLPVWAVQWHPEKMCLRFAREDTVDGLPVFTEFIRSIP